VDFLRNSTVKYFPQLLLIGIIILQLLLCFRLWLPVEYDASNSALAWLENKRMLTPQEQAGAKDSLKWAARTYVSCFRINCNVALLYFNLYGRKKRLILNFYIITYQIKFNFNGFGFFFSNYFTFLKVGSCRSICWSKEMKVSVLTPSIAWILMLVH
jgi:hypothetical protein